MMILTVGIKMIFMAMQSRLLTGNAWLDIMGVHYGISYLIVTLLYTHIQRNV
jgi:hypothetical protein